MRKILGVPPDHKSAARSDEPPKFIRGDAYSPHELLAMLNAGEVEFYRVDATGQAFFRRKSGELAADDVRTGNYPPIRIGSSSGVRFR